MGMRQSGLETLELGTGVAPSNPSEKGPSFHYFEMLVSAKSIYSTTRISRTEN